MSSHVLMEDLLFTCLVLLTLVEACYLSFTLKCLSSIFFRSRSVEEKEGGAEG